MNELQSYAKYLNILTNLTTTLCV